MQKLQKGENDLRTVSAKKNYLYNLAYQLVTILTPIITTPYVSRVLTANGVGQASFTTSLITYFVLFASLGFAIYAQREIAKNIGNKEEQTKIFWEVNICKILSVALALAVNVVLILTGVYAGNGTLMLILCINIIAVALDISFMYQGNEDFGKLAITNIVCKLLMTVAIFLFVKMSNDVWIYVLINSLGLFLGYFVMWFFLGKFICKIDIKQLKPFRHLKGSLILFIPAITITLYTVLDKSMIGFITNSNAENGIYEQANKIAQIALTIVTCMGAVMIPRNSKNYKEGNLEAVKQNIYKTMHFMWILSIPMCLGMAVVASNFIPWFLGEDFYGSIRIIQVFSLLFIFVGFSNVIGIQYLLPTLQDKKYTIGIFAGAIINVCINIPLIYFFGALGASIATVISELTVSIVMFYLVRKEVSFKETFKTIFKPLTAGLVMFCVIFPLSMLLSSTILNTFIIVFAGMFVYAVMIFALKDDLAISLTKQFYQKIFKRNSN